MAFKKSKSAVDVPESPDQLLTDMPRRKIKGVLHHQGEMLKSYAKSAVEVADVALQLPTGSGKTLVGLLIAEWRRRKFHERVVYLCPTRQLVHQTVEQAQDKYGLSVDGFTGPKSDYPTATKTRYQQNEQIAVTTYSSLFNVNPFFNDADVIIIDDAHTSENYIASLWTVSISRSEHEDLHAALCGLLKPLLKTSDYSRLNEEINSDTDLGWADKLPTPAFARIHTEFQNLLDTHARGKDIRFSWSMVRDHLHACHLYLSPNEILLRPLIPPTWTHMPFASAKQRIYMSATLGAGGDLERLTGRRSITRLPNPEDRQGIGRRFFIFPEMSLDDHNVGHLQQRLMAEAGRSLVLVPSSQAEHDVVKEVENSLAFKCFNADAIEESKSAFVAETNAVAVVANRYDGIDFPGDDCRLLFVDGFPRAMNAQERFLMSRMGANILYNERVQTRVLQAIGRCTRSLEDYSAVVATGDDLPQYLTERKRRQYFHPELQAEIEFGIEQSNNASIDDILDNFAIFLENGREWEAANNEILAKRNKARRIEFPAMSDLQGVVRSEVEYQERLWQGDFEAALGFADSVLGRMNHADLKGYRALWSYLAGSAAWLGSKRQSDGLAIRARALFTAAKSAAPTLPWLIDLAKAQPASEAEEEGDTSVYEQVERIEATLERIGTLHSRAFDQLEKEILEGLNSKERFELAHVRLGEALGFIAGKRETDASPDPWWTTGKSCFVFEDHAGATTDTLDATKARQVSTHPNWIRQNVQLNEGTTIYPILVSDVTRMEDGATPHLGDVFFWKLSEFRSWAKTSMATLRELRRTFSDCGDLEWRATAAETLRHNMMDAASLLKMLSKRIAATQLRPASKK